MDEQAVIALVERLVTEFSADAKNVEHLKRGRVEDTIATDLANKLKPDFETSKVTVDAHYNRHLQATKRLNGKRIHLDIAIHERGGDERNLIAIELETNNDPVRDDIWKLEGLTQPLGGYGYQLGLFLVLGIKDRAGEIISIEWYKEGHKI